MEVENTPLTEHQVAELYGISVHTLRQHRFLRKGIPYSKIGRLVRYSKRDVLEYMNQNRISFSEEV